VAAPLKESDGGDLSYRDTYVFDQIAAMVGMKFDSRMGSARSL
jgi:hypothetical protein